MENFEGGGGSVSASRQICSTNNCALTKSTVTDALIKHEQIEIDTSRH